ncbi:MAG TPA: hypothetical protein VHX44_13080, partial [Planctomycetota bacterium]|nr:hypothetical protein [Planctomycetota bacterium]
MSRRPRAIRPHAVVAWVLLLLVHLSSLSWALESDAAVIRTHLIGHAGPTAPASERVVLINEAHRDVAVIAADATSAHLHARDFDATLPWRMLDDAALSALAAPSIAEAEDAVVVAWLRLTALVTPRDRR